MLKTIYHKQNGPQEMYEIDARAAVSRHPAEWSNEPWPEGVVTASEPVEPGTGGGVVEIYEAREKGKGWWAIYDANGTEMGKSIRENDGVAFNQMTAEDRAEYVAAHVAES